MDYHKELIAVYAHSSPAMVKPQWALAGVHGAHLGYLQHDPLFSGSNLLWGSSYPRSYTCQGDAGWAILLVASEVAGGSAPDQQLNQQCAGATKRLSLKNP